MNEVYHQGRWYNFGSGSYDTWKAEQPTMESSEFCDDCPQCCPELAEAGFVCERDCPCHSCHGEFDER
jgi:hypothetical protein